MIKRNMLGFVRKITALNPVIERTGQAQPSTDPSYTVNNYVHTGPVQPVYGRHYLK